MTDLSIPIVIGIGGYATAGKDAVADVLVEKFGFVKIYMSKPIREALLKLNPFVRLKLEEETIYARALEKSGIEYWNIDHSTLHIPYCELDELLGYEGSKRIEGVRRLQQVLGTEVGRDMIDPDIWVNIARRDIRNLTNEGKSVVVTGIRNGGNEMAMISDVGWRRHATWWVSRPNVGPANSHASEHTLTEGDFDDVIQNAGQLVDLPVFVEQGLQRISDREAARARNHATRVLTRADLGIGLTE